MTESESTAPTVHQAWAAVMADVRELEKGDRNQHFGFNFRGIDAVMNATGPVLRRHRVAVVPRVTSANYRDVQTAKGKPAREVTLVVEFTVYGPAGDSFTGAAPGESMDEGDKGTAKAMSVAMRTFMLQALCLPTHDTDPDAESYERAPELSHEARQAQAQDTADKLLVTNDLATVQRVHAWATERGLIGSEVADADGELLPLGTLFARVAARLEAAEAERQPPAKGGAAA
jgi:hypothetical protein